MLHPTLMLRIAAEQHRDAITEAAQARRAGHARRFRHAGGPLSATVRQLQLRSDLAPSPAATRQPQPIPTPFTAPRSGPSSDLTATGQSERCPDLVGHVG